jgi:DNA-binding NarL/FixJ family response regulator
MNQHNDYCVLVVDDHYMMRLGLKTFAQSTSNFTVQWLDASNLVDALEIFRNHSQIDLVLLDLNLPDSQGLQSVQRFLSEFPGVRLVVHSATEDEFVVRQALALGVIGFIPKSISAEAMLVLLESLLAGSREANNQRSSHSLSPQPGMHSSSVTRNLQAYEVGLTPTQLKVLELVLAGLSNQEVATECKLALGTVKNTVSSIMLVLNVNSRSHLISLFR